MANMKSVLVVSTMEALATEDISSEIGAGPLLNLSPFDKRLHGRVRGGLNVEFDISFSSCHGCGLDSE